MNYIVFDLEWNQCPFGKEKEERELPFEIIEIGAVKLDEKLRIVDDFHALIRPVIYKSMHMHTSDVVQLDMGELEHGQPFLKACKNFLNWCGKDIIFCTWGSMDLMELQRNMKYFCLENTLPFPLFYYDVQKLYSIFFDDGKSRVSLEHAVDALLIDKSIPFHRADADTWYTAEVLRRLDLNVVGQYRSIDYYRLPKTHKEEIYVTYDTYSKYVSREFESKEKLLEDNEVKSTRCYLCKKKIKRKIRWFSYNNRSYYSLMYCDVHGWIKGKLRIKRTLDGSYFAVKTIKITDGEGALLVRKKKEEVELRKRMKKQGTEK